MFSPSSDVPLPWPKTAVNSLLSAPTAPVSEKVGK